MDLRILSTPLEKLPTSGLTLEFKPSKILIGIYSVFLFLLLVAIFISPVILWQRLVMLLIVFWSVQVIFRKYLLLNHPRAIQKLVLTELDWCYVQLKNAQIFKATFLADTVVTEHLVILNLEFNLEKNVLLKCFNRYSVIISAQTLGPDQFRDFKRYLRLLRIKSD